MAKRHTSESLRTHFNKILRKKRKNLISELPVESNTIEADNDDESIPIFHTQMEPFINKLDSNLRYIQSAFIADNTANSSREEEDFEDALDGVPQIEDEDCNENSLKEEINETQNAILALKNHSCTNEEIIEDASEEPLTHMESQINSDSIFSSEKVVVQSLLNADGSSPQNTQTLKPSNSEFSEIINGISKELNVDKLVVIYALYIFNGNVDNAILYLLNDKLIIKNWTFSEDEIIVKSNESTLSIPGRSKEEIEQRFHFIKNSPLSN